MDRSDFIFIFFDEDIFISQQRMHFLLVVLFCCFFILKLVFIHFFVLFDFFALLLIFSIGSELQLPEFVLKSAAVPAVGLDLCDVGSDFDSE